MNQSESQREREKREELKIVDEEHEIAWKANSIPRIIHLVSSFNNSWPASRLPETLNNYRNGGREEEEEEEEETCNLNSAW